MTESEAIFNIPNYELLGLNKGQLLGLWKYPIPVLSWRGTLVGFSQASLCAVAASLRHSIHGAQLHHRYSSGGLVDPFHEMLLSLDSILDVMAR